MEQQKADKAFEEGWAAGRAVLLDQLKTAPIAETKVENDQLWVRLDEFTPEKHGSIRLLYEPTLIK